MSINLERPQAVLIDHMLSTKQYFQLEEYLNSLKLNDEKIMNSVYLAQAILNVDIDRVEKLSPQCNQNYLLKPTRIQQKVYYYSQYLKLQIQQKEYSDYFRGLTPVLVDIFRLIIECDFMPDINQYIAPVIKDTADGVPLYRGLQWKQDKIEAKPNKIQETFVKYYGEYFNYEHYVGSTHLMKLIDDHSQKDEIKDLSNQMRYIEKYMRNITAHEVISVDEALIKKRTNLTIEEIQDIYDSLLKFAGLTDERQLNCLETINQEIRTQLNINK